LPTTNKKTGFSGPAPSNLKRLLLLSGAFTVVLMVSFLVIGYVLPGKVARGMVERSKKPKVLEGSPSGVGLSYQDVSFKTADGLSLSGWWVPAPKGDVLGTVVLAHGIFNNRMQMLGRAEFLHKGRYNVLMFDLRGHGKSDLAPLTGGLDEAKDLVAAADYLKKSGKQKGPLVFFGLSLGAMAALRAGEMVPQAVIVADSPLADVRSYISGRTIAHWFVFLPGFFERMLGEYNRQAGTSLTLDDMDLNPVAKRLEGRRVLVFAGEKDDLARPKDVNRLFTNLATRTKQYYLAPGGHDGTYQSAPALYKQTVLSFLQGTPHSLKSEKKGR
jgi:pimeloyl-ACP methyl ester carboxylesterase